MEGVFCEPDPSGSVRGQVGETSGKVDGGVCMPGPSLSTSCVFWCARPHRLRPKGSAFRSVSGLLAKGFHVSSLRNGGCRVGVQYSSGQQLSSHCHGNIQSVAVAEDNYSVNRAGSEAWLVPS